MLTVAVCTILILAALGGGYLLGYGTGTPLCVVCKAPLPRVHPDGRCGGTPGVDPEAAEALRSIQRRLAHAIYTTAAGGGDGTAVVVCECGWTVEMATLAEAREEHRAHVDGEDQ